MHYYIVAGNQYWDLDHNMMVVAWYREAIFWSSCFEGSWLCLFLRWEVLGLAYIDQMVGWQGFMIRDWLPNNLLLQWLEDHCAECEFIQSAHAHLRGGAPMCHSCLFWCWIEWELHAGFTRLSAHAAQYKVSKISLSQSTLSSQPSNITIAW